jgi:hypothetical protein
VDARTRPLPECGWLDQLMLALPEPFEQAVGAFGLLGGALDDTANQEELRIVAAMQLGMDGFHSNTPWSLGVLILTRFLDANRYPLRSKTL